MFLLENEEPYRRERSGVRNRLWNFTDRCRYTSILTFGISLDNRMSRPFYHSTVRGRSVKLYSRFLCECVETYSILNELFRRCAMCMLCMLTRIIAQCTYYYYYILFAYWTISRNEPLSYHNNINDNQKQNMNVRIASVVYEYRLYLPEEKWCDGHIISFSMVYISVTLGPALLKSLLTNWTIERITATQQAQVHHIS